MADKVTVSFRARWAEFMRLRVVDNYELCENSVADHDRIDANLGIKSAAELAPAEQIWRVEAKERLAVAAAMRDQALAWDEDDEVLTLTADGRALEAFLVDVIYCIAPQAPADRMVISDELFEWIGRVEMLGEMCDEVVAARAGEEA